VGGYAAAGEHGDRTDTANGRRACAREAAAPKPEPEEPRMTAAEPRSAPPLTRGETRSFQLAPGETVEIHVVAGVCWVTLEDDPDDYVVSQMKTLLLEGPGLIVIQGMELANHFAITRLAVS
jgi:hypothetical protein